MAEAKHSFVDDNPYLVYSPNAEMTYNGNSGGGSGAGFPVVESNETGTLSVTAGELVEMLGNNPVLLKTAGDDFTKWFLFTVYSNDFATYTFKAISISGQNSEIMIWGATLATDYPEPVEP